MALTARESVGKMNYLPMNVSYCGLTWSIYIFLKRKRKICRLRKGKHFFIPRNVQRKKKKNLIRNARKFSSDCQKKQSISYRYH